MTLLSTSAQQLTPPAATSDEIDFFHYLLISIADPAIDPNMAKQNEVSLVRLYGLNAEEAAAFHAAGERFASAMTDFRNKRRTILAGKVIPNAADEAALTAVSSELEHGIAASTNELLNSLSPGKAVLLRLQGHLIAQTSAAAKAKVVEANQSSVKGVN
jgi:acyl-coenzyme A thioesterase PaaI-like protein